MASRRAPHYFPPRKFDHVPGNAFAIAHRLNFDTYSRVVNRLPPGGHQAHAGQPCPPRFQKGHDDQLRIRGKGLGWTAPFTHQRRGFTTSMEGHSLNALIRRIAVPRQRRPRRLSRVSKIETVLFPFKGFDEPSCPAPFNRAITGNVAVRPW